MSIKHYKGIDDLPLVLSVTEIAEILGVGRNMAYALIREGSIRSIRAKSRILIPRSELIRYLDGSAT